VVGLGRVIAARDAAIGPWAKQPKALDFHVFARGDGVLDRSRRSGRRPLRSRRRFRACLFLRVTRCLGEAPLKSSMKVGANALPASMLPPRGGASTITPVMEVDGSFTYRPADGLASVSRRREGPSLSALRFGGVPPIPPREGGRPGPRAPRWRRRRRRPGWPPAGLPRANSQSRGQSPRRMADAVSSDLSGRQGADKAITPAPASFFIPADEAAPPSPIRSGVETISTCSRPGFHPTSPARP
jgi:hypothetical protein